MPILANFVLSDWPAARNQSDNDFVTIVLHSVLRALAIDYAWMLGIPETFAEFWNVQVSGIRTVAARSGTIESVLIPL